MSLGRRWRYRAATFRRRLLADLLDAGLLTGAVVMLWRWGLIAEPLPPLRGDLLDGAADFVAEDRVLLLPAAVAVLFIGLAYGALTRAAFGGTLGERVLGLRLLDPAGAPAGPIRAGLHGVATLLALLPVGLGYMWAVLDRDRRTFADHLTGTRLVRGRPVPDTPRRAES